MMILDDYEGNKINIQNNNTLICHFLFFKNTIDQIFNIHDFNKTYIV